MVAPEGDASGGAGVHAQDLIRFSWGHRLRRSAGRLQAVLRLDRWFPQVPVALAVAGLGALSVLNSLPHLVGLVPELQLLTPAASLAQMPVLSALGTVPDLVSGVVLFIMAVGLLFRSRLSWALTLLLAAVSLALLLRQYGLVWSVMMVLNGAILVALLVFRRHFSRSSVAAGTLFATLSILLLMGYAILGSYVLGAGFRPKINSLVTAVYFAVVTMSTVGYGDIVPVSSDARLFVVSIILLGITVFATSISAVILPLVNGRMQQLLLGEKRAKVQNHYLLIGDNALAQNAYRALRRRHGRVLVLLSRPPENPWVQEGDLILGDATDPVVLRNAGALHALGVLALRSDDSENAFIVLAAKDLGVPGKTVALVSDQRHFHRIRQAGADLLIAPEVIGGRLLVHGLTGEDVAGADILAGVFGTAQGEVPG